EGPAARTRALPRVVAMPAGYDDNVPAHGQAPQQGEAVVVSRVYQDHCREAVGHGNELETALQGIAIRGQEHRSGGGQMLHADRLELKLAQAFQPEPGAYQEIRQLEPERYQDADGHERCAKEKVLRQALVVVYSLALVFRAQNI